MRLTRDRVHRGDAREEVAREAVAARRGGGIGPVRLDHVVDRGHVDGVLHGDDAVSLYQIGTEGRAEHTLAMAIIAAKIIGAIQGTCGGPKLVHAKPNRPIGSRGAAGEAS